MNNNTQDLKKAAHTVEGGLKLASDTFEQAVSRVHEFHRAISDMPFKAVDAASMSASKPVEAVHNEITDLVYTAVRETGKTALGGAAWLVKQARHNESAMTVANQWVGSPKKPGKALNAVASAVNGLIGDHLTATRNPVEVKAGFFAAGERLTLEKSELEASFPQASKTLVVFVHGLCCNEDSWFLYMREDDPLSVPYGPRLENEKGVSAVYLRYNTGRSIEANARQFKRLLSRLDRHWPVELERIVLVGHSMGGLVSRAMVEMLDVDEAMLQPKISDVICLGSPHTGSPLARLAAEGETLLGRYNLARPVSKVLSVRSTGIRNLQDGLGALKTALGREVRFHLVGSTIASRPDSLLTETLGDGLVQLSSALADHSGKAGQTAHLRKHHMQLLNDPDIYPQIEAVIGSEAPTKRRTGLKKLPRLG